MAIHHLPGEGHGNPLQYSCLGTPHGQRKWVGYSPWVHKESGMTERPSNHLPSYISYRCLCFLFLFCFFCCCSHFFVLFCFFLEGLVHYFKKTHQFLESKQLYYWFFFLSIGTKRDHTKGDYILSQLTCQMYT